MQLNILNEERRAIEAAVQDAAEAMTSAQHNRAIAVLAGKGWHPGVIGIVPGRLKQKLGVPAIVIALDEDGMGQGPGRYLAGADLGAAIMAAQDNGILFSGGGHSMSAGLRGAG